MKRNRLFSVRSWRPPLLTMAGALVLVAVLIFRLGTLVPSLSAGEVAARANANSLHYILRNPVNLPYSLPVYVLIRLHHHGALALRGVAVLYGLLTLSLFFYILRRWQSERIAAFSTFLLGTSSWFLHTARTGTPNVLLLGLLGMVTTGLWLRNTHHRTLALYACVAAITVSLYTPGFVWFALAGIIWRRRVVAAEIRHIAAWQIAAGVVLFGALLAPLGYGMYHQPTLLLTIAGLPRRVPALHALVSNLTNIPLLLFVRGPAPNPALWLGRLPILDIFDIAMFALGLYTYVQHWRLDRASVLLGVIVLSCLLITMGGLVNITILVPFVYLVIAGGITYLLREWFSVFPLNPIARNVGLAVMLLAILASSTYQLNRYFVAWPHSPATRAVYTGQT